MIFADRRDAGQALAQALAHSDRFDPVVLALPRGGVPVAAEVARALSAPLDVFLVRKLGVPGHEELAFGAIAEGGVRVLNDAIVRVAGLTRAEIERVAIDESRELERRAHAYRGDREPLELEGREIVLVDDGLATGATMRAAVRALRVLEPGRVVVAVPVASDEACELLSSEADEVVCVSTPRPFRGVGAWYADFPQTSDEEVTSLLAAHRAPRGGTTSLSSGYRRSP